MLIKKKSLKFLTILLDSIRNMRDMGILQKIFREKTTNATYCNVQPGKEFAFQERSLNIIDLASLFFILGAGIQRI